MNLGEARTLVRAYINEKIAATWSDAQLNGLVQEANREVWHKLSTQCPNWLAGSTIFVYPANATVLSLPAVVPIGGGTIGILQKVLGFFTLPTFAQPSQNNLPFPMRGYGKIADLYLTGQGESGGYQQSLYSQQWAYSYTLMGTDLYLWPVPQQAVNILAFAVPTVATPTGDANNLFVGGVIANPTRLLDHQELVPLLAAVKAKTMVGDPDNGLTDVFKARLQSTIQVLTLDQQQQDPLQVRGIR